jgi:putative copper export protein/methionine-rich copper-binding protein CopC
LREDARPLNLLPVRSQPSRLVSRLVAVLALAVLATPALLLAHAHLLRSDPANDSVVAPPSAIRLWFSEAPDLRFSRVSVQDSAGREIEVGALSSIKPMGLQLALTGRLHGGPYVVQWITAASDGHRTNGTVRFRVRKDSAGAGAGAAAAPAVTVAPQVTVRVDTSAASRRPTRNSNAVFTPTEVVPMSTAVRWAEFVALLTVIGAIIFRLAVLPASKWPDALLADAADRTRRLAVAFAILYILATLTRALAQAQMLAVPVTSRLDGLRILVTSTHWGVAWAIGIVGAVVMFVGLMVARVGLPGWVIAALGVVAVTVSEALTGHSGASPHYLALAMAADVAHQLAAGGWIGGLACVVVAGLRTTRTLPDDEGRAAGSQLVRAYHASALECVALVLLSGIIAAFIRLNAFSQLWTTPYGSMLFRKLVFVAVVLGFGYFHWRRVVTPEWDADTRFRFARSATFELIVAAVVIAFTALLVSTQLP